jgi:hypothetical protein
MSFWDWLFPKEEYVELEIVKDHGDCVEVKIKEVKNGFE